MEESTVIEMGLETVAPSPEAIGGTPSGAGEGGGAVSEAARLPDIATWLSCGSFWLYAIPVILLLFLWLFYPAILILVCLILILWLLG